MGRTEIVNARAKELNELTDMDLAKEIVSYFQENSTMPGEKDIKTRATMLWDELSQEEIHGVTSEVRKDLVEEFASLLVKEVKVKGILSLNENKVNKGTEGMKASDLPMVLTDVDPVARKETYEMPVLIDNGYNVCTEDGRVVGMLPNGFKKNHAHVKGMSGTAVVTDYSNSNLANLSCRLIIDLGQPVVMAAA